MNKSAKIMTALLLSGLTFSSCVRFNRTIDISKEKVEVVNRNYKEISTFERIYVDAACEIEYTQSDTTSVTATGDKDDLDALMVKVEDGKLIIKFKQTKNISRISDIDDIKFVISSPDLIEVNMRGAGEFETQGVVDTDTLRLLLKGAGQVDIDHLICDRLETTLHGTGNFDFDDITCQSALIELKGVGNIKANFTSGGDVEANLKGVGNIEIEGNIRAISKSVKGTGNIQIDALVEQSN
ncbi:MAG: DUF2807 domain-containing protein [Prevotella sp.]|nr:DUF2807 domain-containing protein [Prevotella sp.]